MPFLAPEKMRQKYWSAQSIVAVLLSMLFVPIPLLLCCCLCYSAAHFVRSARIFNESCLLRWGRLFCLHFFVLPNLQLITRNWAAIRRASNDRLLHIVCNLWTSQEWPITLQPISMEAIFLLFSDWHVTPVAGYVVRPQAQTHQQRLSTSPCFPAAIMLGTSE